MPDPSIFQMIPNALWRIKNRYAARAPARTPPPRSFVFAPEPAQIGRSEIGQELLAHRFSFAHQSVNAPGWSIWKIDQPDAAFTEALHRFGWLDDLVAVGNAPARAQAQEWVLEWVRFYGKGTGPGWHPATTAQRLRQQCQHAGFVQEGLSDKDKKRWLASLGRQADFLTRRCKAIPPGLARFTALTGLLFADLSLEGRQKMVRKTCAALAQECQTSIGAHGEIGSRNPQTLLHIFALIVAANSALAKAGQPENTQMLDAALRMAPTLRSLRLGDGGLAAFYGGGRGAQGLLDQALAQVKTDHPVINDKVMDYQRMSAGRLVVIADVGLPPAGKPAQTLGFELSSGMRLVVTNPTGTAAFNGLTMGTDAPAFTPELVTCNRAQDLSGVWMVATHDGFAAAHNLITERRLFIASDGRTFSGEDSLKPARDTDRPAPVEPFALRFHIDPQVDTVLTPDLRAAMLTLPNGEEWRFSMEGGLLTLEDFSAPGHPATKQIVVSSRTVAYTGRIIWSFSRTIDAN